jgi:hypothetical protein
MVLSPACEVLLLSMGDLESPNTDPGALAVRVLTYVLRNDSILFHSLLFPSPHFPRIVMQVVCLPRLCPCPFRASAGDLSSIFLREDIPEDKRTRSNYIYIQHRLDGGGWAQESLRIFNVDVEADVRVATSTRVHLHDLQRGEVAPFE